jgi:hypothetical protein
MAKFRRLLAMCRDFGIYVIPSGPDHWEGRPAWRQAVPYADEAMLRADEAWWKEFAALCRDEPAVLAYDLYNEPMIGWDSPGMLERWRQWLSSMYGSVEAMAQAWNVPVASLPPLDRAEIPPAKPARGDARLFDYQRFRESIGDEWTRRLAAAIRSADRNHLITIGHIQWAAPVKLAAEVKHYAGFNLASNAKLLDLMTIHFYPMDEPPPYVGPEGFAANAVYLEAVLLQASVGKPLLVGEFGWYGGGALVVDGREVYPDRPMSHQLEWNRLLLDVSRGRVCGWLNWAFADPPEARDLSRWSGCWTTDLVLKPWGEEFGRFARDVTRKPPEPREAPAWLRSFEFDRKALVTDPQAGAETRLELRRRRAAAP